MSIILLITFPTKLIFANKASHMLATSIFINSYATLRTRLGPKVHINFINDRIPSFFREYILYLSNYPILIWNI